MSSLKKFDDVEALKEIVESEQQFSPVQIIGIMIAKMHEHYLEEHKKVLMKLHGTRNDPIYLTRVIENNLKQKYNPDTNAFEIVEPQSMLLKL